MKTEVRKSDLTSQPALAIRTPFAENLYIVDHKRRHKFVNIAKCGVTTIKKIIAEDAGLKYDSVHELHKQFGMRADMKFAVHVDRDMFGDDYTRVAVYRDPYDRFMSWYRDKVLNPKQLYVFYSGIAKENNFERLIEFLEFELSKKDPEWIDEHLRPQARYYLPQSVDTVVLLKDLNKYLKSIGVPKQDINIYNKTEVDLKEERQTPQWFIRKIESMYHEDYKLLNNIKDKLWKYNTQNSQESR